MYYMKIFTYYDPLRPAIYCIVGIPNRTTVAPSSITGDRSQERVVPSDYKAWQRSMDWGRLPSSPIAPSPSVAGLPTELALETTVFLRLLSSVFTESWWNCTYWYTARIITSTTTDLSTESYLSHWYRHNGGHQSSPIVPNLHLLKPPVGHQCQILLE